MIPLGELFRELDESGAGVRLLLVDACRNDPLSSRGRNIDLDTLPRPSQGTPALFSCKGGEKAFETSKLGKKGHGVFFHHVIEGLKGKAANDRGEVTWARMADYVIERVSDDVPQLIGGGARQTPHEVKNLIGISPVLAASKLDAEMLAGWFQKGEEYLHGRGVARDPAEALLWYRKAAARGHAGAMKQLGWMYQKGLGVKPSHTEAMAWYRKSAARGNAAAINQLGWMHQNGLGVTKDDAEAIRHYRRAAQQGHAVAMFNLAFLTEKGRGTGANLKEALTWYRKAAELGDVPARQRVDQLERTSTK